MLVRADPQQNTLSLFSFPRDLVVPIYCNDQTTPITTDRINTAWTSCGPAGTLNTVEKLTGIPVNYLITIDFHGFKLLVNKLHGVYMDVDRRYLNTVGGPAAPRRSTSSRVISASPASRRSTSSGTATPTAISTALRASSSSSSRSRIASRPASPSSTSRS